MAEIDAYLENGAEVTANLSSLPADDRSRTQSHYQNDPRVSYSCFDAANDDQLLDAISEGLIGFDAVAYPPNIRGFTENVLSAVCDNKSLRHALALIGCPNDSLESFGAIKVSAQARGIEIISAGGFHARAVAEYTLCQIGFHARRLPFFYSETGKMGRWPHKEALASTRTLESKVLGIIGASGRDGAAIAALAIRMGLRVVCSKSRSKESEAKLVGMGASIAPDLRELLSTADFLSINCRSAEETHGMVGEAEIALMKTGVIIINPAGAEILSKEAILAEFSKLAAARRIGALVLDMAYGRQRGEDAFVVDPVNAALKDRGVWFTPRIAGYTQDSRICAVKHLADEIGRRLNADAKDGHPVLNETFQDRLTEDLITAIHEADRQAVDLRSTGLDVAYKADQSPVTSADSMVERAIATALRDRGYKFNFAGEELDLLEDAHANFDVLVDGIDGTRNFRDGNYGWCTSVAVTKNTEPWISVINDAHSSEVYVARRGFGAYRRTLSRSVPIRVPDALPADFSFSIGSFRIAGSREVKQRIIEGIKTLGGREREWGCVGLSICAVARGGLGVFIQFNSPSHDHEAAVLVAEEAGASVRIIRREASERADLIVCHPALGARINAIVDSEISVLLKTSVEKG